MNLVQLRNGRPMEVYLGAAPRILRGRGARDRDRRARAREIWPAGLCAARDRPQQIRGRKPEEQGRDLRRGPVGSAAAGRHRVQRPWGGQERRGGSRGARPAGPQRHLPAGDQGPQPGQALYVQGPGADPDRPCRPPRGRGNHGPGSRPGAAGPECRRRRSVNAADGHPGGLYHPDHPQRGRHQGHNCRPSGPFYRYSRPGHPGYLLCDTEPPICGKGPEQARGRHPGGGGHQ